MPVAGTSHLVKTRVLYQKTVKNDDGEVDLGETLMRGPKRLLGGGVGTD